MQIVGAITTWSHISVTTGMSIDHTMTMVPLISTHVIYVEPLTHLIKNLTHYVESGLLSEST